MRNHASWQSKWIRASRGSGLLRLGVLLGLLALFVAGQGAHSAPLMAAAPPQPTYGSAVIDGSASEWNLTNDFFMNNCAGFDCSKHPVTSITYVRYDCVTQTLFVLVKVASGTLDTTGDQWVEIDGSKVIHNLNGITSAGVFAYLTDSSGWEGSATPIATGSHTIQVHASVDGTTSGSTTASLSLTCTDWGDLPTGYGIVTSAQNGARHTIGNLYMGTYIDGESDGQPSAAANLDDTTNPPDDEDGVVADPTLVWTVAGGGRVRITVTGPGAGVIGCVSGWMDFNNDGDFNDSGENIINNVSMTSGTTSILFTIPAGTTLPGTFFSRFRLYAAVGGSCTSIVPSLTGSATNGEVEDYRIASVTTSTASHLASFAGVARNSFAVLKWSTDNELGMSGSNVWRANKRNGTFVKLNTNEIRAKTGSIAGNNYRFKDKTAKPGKTYFYKVQLVGPGGATLESSGVVKVRIASAP